MVAAMPRNAVATAIDSYGPHNFGLRVSLATTQIQSVPGAGESDRPARATPSSQLPLRRHATGIGPTVELRSPGVHSLRPMTMRTAALAAAVSLSVVLAPTAAADPTVDKFGGWNRLVDNGGAVITVWKVSDLRPSTDTVPGYPLAGQLWEATASVRAAKGSVTPIIPDFNARAADGANYPVLWQAATPAGISGATLPPGAKASGKLYFDVTGPAPTQVLYNNGVEDLLVWK